MRNFKIIVPYKETHTGWYVKEFCVDRVYTLEVKEGKLKLAKDLILTLDSLEYVSENRYNASFLKSDGSKCYYKNFFIEQRDLEKWIKSEKITDNRKKNQRMEVDDEIEQD